MNRATSSADGALSREERVELLGQRGGTVWLTGLSGSGKTTLSTAVEKALVLDGYFVSRLDGDDVRQHLCRDLGFDRDARGENVRRVAEVARVLGGAGVIVLVALISPYAIDRQQARELHAEAGLPFIEVFLDTSVEVCRSRDPKGLYEKAGRGELHMLTGVDDPYEPPQHPELTVATEPLERSVEAILGALSSAGMLSRHPVGHATPNP
ncbi:MAG: adenylyl-sulfate kinase [Solirubrobacterales bacterium]|nr:adenylyl-sulfate kinase [Solirubrobacterales bacterium]